MPQCTAEPVMWKQRRAFRLSNGHIELTVLLGGGHIADLRHCGSSVNAMWEAPWPTIETYLFSDGEHSSLYGERAVGQMLSGYTGHALALGYFGMPSAEQVKQGLSLHGEAASAEWHIVQAEANDQFAMLTMEVELQRTALRCKRKLRLAANTYTVAVQETVWNLSSQPADFQWVQHVAFGEPLFARGEASLSLRGKHGITWPLGYEGHELLPENQQFEWPNVPTENGEIDLSQPFLKDGTGFVAAVRADPERSDAFIAVHNRSLALAAGYVYEARRFPWIALWEENRARTYAPWKGITRVRGVEFGTSPMPLGLEQAQRTQKLFETPVVAVIEGGEQLTTAYDIFVVKVPPDWSALHDVTREQNHLILHSQTDARIVISSSAPASGSKPTRGHAQTL